MSFVSVATGQAGTDAGMALARPMRLESAALQADTPSFARGCRGAVPETCNRQLPAVQPAAGYKIERRAVAPSGV